MGRHDRRADDETARGAVPRRRVRHVRADARVRPPATSCAASRRITARRRTASTVGRRLRCSRSSGSAGRSCCPVRPGVGGTMRPTVAAPMTPRRPPSAGSRAQRQAPPAAARGRARLRTGAAAWRRPDAGAARRRRGAARSARAPTECADRQDPALRALVEQVAARGGRRARGGHHRRSACPGGERGVTSRCGTARRGPAHGALPAARHGTASPSAGALSAPDGVRRHRRRQQPAGDGPDAPAAVRGPPRRRWPSQLAPRL